MTRPISYAELDEILARAEKATPEPWYGKQNDLIGGWCIGTSPKAPSETREGADIGDFISAEDVAFLSSARTDVPDLVEEVRRLREVLEIIRHKSGDQHVSDGVPIGGSDDPGYDGIYAVADHALRGEGGEDA